MKFAPPLSGLDLGEHQRGDTLRPAQRFQSCRPVAGPQRSPPLRITYLPSKSQDHRSVAAPLHHVGDSVEALARDTIDAFDVGCDQRIYELVRDDLTRPVCPVVHWTCFVTRRRVLSRPRVHSLLQRRYCTESVQHEDALDLDAETLR